MNKLELQIVAFNNPYPPDYGGAIDVYYKIKALSNLGVKLYLHIFYEDRSEFTDLNEMCEKLYVYKRHTSLLNHFSIFPYGIVSRKSKDLIYNLNKNKAPILFESIRSIYPLWKKNFKQKVGVRCHNIEHEYSWGLVKSEKNILKKLVFLVEGYKYKYSEIILQKSDYIFSISYYEFDYFKSKYNCKSYFLPVFQENSVLESKSGLGKYALYHGDLSVADNIRSAMFIAEVFKNLKFPLIIASSTKVKEIIYKINKHKNISFQQISTQEELNDLIKNAHVNTLYSFQKSGTKLKVFNAIFKGRHIILNENMVDDKVILKECILANTSVDYQKAVTEIFTKEFEITTEREELLKKYKSEENARRLIEIML